MKTTEKDIQQLKDSITNRRRYATAKRIITKYLGYTIRYSPHCWIDLNSFKHVLGRMLKDDFGFKPTDAADAASTFVEIWREKNGR